MKPGKAMKPKQHRRLVTMSVVLPCTVVLEVGSNDPDAVDVEWTILAVRRSSCEAAPTTVRENMDDSEWRELDRLASDAEDLP